MQLLYPQQIALIFPLSTYERIADLHNSAATLNTRSSFPDVNTFLTFVIVNTDGV